jgi:site-specific DNA-methyltransferase (adenine-specific)
MTKYKQVNNIESLVIAERTKHSKKPEEVRKRIELLFGDVPRLEMFARQASEGWDVFGNEVANSINISAT